MDDRSLKVLEFYSLLDILKSFSVSPLGQKQCMALRPTRDRTLIESRLTEVMELKEILERGEDLPLQGLKDIEPDLQRLEVEGAVLGVEEILDILNQMRLCRGLKRFFLSSKAKAPCLHERISGLSDLRALEKEILRVIHPKGEILDRASPSLSEIRHQLEAAREKAKGVLERLLHQEDLQSLFQEQLITLRNGRYVLLLKSDFKHRLEGIIHDQSHSQRSLFFEPLPVVSINNEVSILTTEEKEEEYRIREALSEKMRGEMASLRSDFEILKELDLLYSMARFSIRLRGTRPGLNEKGRIDIKKARNPLLVLQREGQVVPVDLRMGDEIKTLIISGANAGGKTVALKTLGLLILMAQSGLPIPAEEGSEVALFEEVFAVIGDEQNIEENLSTFSAHLLHVNQILEKAGMRSLVLLDELGVGTNASEGCAIAMGFLDQFRERGSTIAVTTHFDGLKAYGYLYPDVENVKVDFDEETTEPRYTLSYGSSGMSNAFLVAEKLGVSREVLERARDHREGGDQKISRTLESLERLKADAEEEKLQFIRMNEEVRKERQRLKEILDRIRKGRLEILSRVEEKARKVAQEMEGELRAWLRRQKEKKPQDPIRRREIQEIRERFFPAMKRKGSSEVASDLKIGAHVRVESLGNEGRLLRVVEPSKRAEVMTDQARVIVPLSDLKVIEGEGSQEKPLPEGQQRSQEMAAEFPRQLNVIGLTVEDALPVVDKFIDQALYHGLEKVDIIHGVGSGRLRTAIGKYLGSHRGVKHFAPGDVLRGGRGITVVELR